MDQFEDYRKKLKEIADYAFSHGSATAGIDQFKDGHLTSLDKEAFDKFVNACHDGFKIAQRLLVEEITKYQKILREATEILKEHRKIRDKIKAEEVENKIKVIKQRLSNFSHIADGIAWQIIGGQIHIARRFYLRQTELKYLDSVNLEHVLETAEIINKNPNDFALISDITGFVQIGDLLIRHGKFIGLMELKEGKVNDQILDFFDSIECRHLQFSELNLLDKFDQKTAKQINRMQRQKERMIRAIDVINNDKGIDPLTSEKMSIGTPAVSTEFYNDDLYRLYEKIQAKNWAYTVIDDCLHIGFYKDESILMAAGIIKAILQQLTENYILIDWLSITSNISSPIFTKPFHPDFIIDILTGRVKIIMGLDIDKLIDLFNQVGLQTRWLTKKETTQKKAIAKKSGIIEVNQRAIEVILPNGQDVLLSGGILSKIFYDSIRPSNMAISMLSADISNLETIQ